MDEKLLLEKNKIACKPFLRWAGGKSWLKKHLAKFLPKDGFNDYHEPFLGGGSIFFHLQPNYSYLSDLNPILIETYNEIKNNVDKVIEELLKFENTEEHYYLVRQKKFRSSAKRAAHFIYLNQTSFNGIFRVNLKGEYNVPYGYRTKEFCEPENLKLVGKLLENTSIKSCSFADTIDNIKEKDLIFLDPPYTVTHNNNGFIKYNAKLFDIQKQYELSEYIDEIKNKGAFYILTNAAHDVVEDIFTKEGDFKQKISRASLIGGINAKRGRYKEFVFTNTQ
ncbi:DNA adenine methylase [Tenacibaculum ascidiaceicola]|uniref:DNA adenine methylase n=1 Tax=Tenacibaculum ascidiaceicola TaxID=1699411 RepID=UPI003892EC84